MPYRCDDSTPFLEDETLREDHHMPARGAVRTLLQHSADLRRTNRELRSKLREHIGQLQVNQARLAGHRAPRPPLGLPPAPDAGEHLRARFGLTARELEVALLLAEGCRNSAIAESLGISPHTARHHTQRVLAKLGARSRAEAGARLRR